MNKPTHKTIAELTHNYPTLLGKDTSFRGMSKGVAEYGSMYHGQWLSVTVKEDEVSDYYLKPAELVTGLLECANVTIVLGNELLYQHSI